ncbi:MAG TPA: macro domain-containing protein [Polyangia bacterium]|nr:macro domain-containing protein [Polyangia bacterium]
MVIHVAPGDLTQLTVDAIVNPTNSLGLMVAGVSSAIREAGGQVIEDEAKASAPIAVGAAVVTTAGELFTKSVIHVPTMEEPGMKIGVENVRRATRAALLAAARNNLQEIAFPAIGTGIGGVPFDEAARAMVDELRAHRQPEPAKVWLIAAKPEMIPHFEEALRLASLP